MQRAQDEETGEDPLLEAFTALRKKIFYWHGNARPPECLRQS